MARRSFALKFLGAAFLGLTLGGAIYEKIGEHRDRKRLPQVGQSIDIGGRSLNIFCSGSGSPAVIFDSGAGSSGYVWSDIQPEVASLTRACWFDRAGLGWSDDGPYPRSGSNMSRDLHTLLQRAGVPPPYVLVGHSLGGLNVRVYNGMYPRDVAGAVLVDAAHEDEPRRAPKFMLGKTAPRFLWHPIWTAAHTARFVGLMRLMSPRAQLPDDPKQRTREQIVEALRLQPKTFATLADPTTPERYNEAVRAGGFGDKPLIVLTRGKIDTPANPSDMDRQYAAYTQVWMHEIQPKLARLSTRGRQIIVEKSGHDIPDEAPETIIAAVREILDDIKAGQTQSRKESTEDLR
ncbi:MAG: alpha/beta fold hydrolase [Gemmatimonadaceae bacterium]